MARDWGRHRQCHAGAFTYVGHAKVSDPNRYLTAVPDLMAVAAKHFELFAAADAEEAQHG